MDSENEQGTGDEGDAAYLTSFEASDRRRKIILIVAGVVFTILVVAGFLMTIGSLGKLGQDVDGAFDDQGNPGEQSAASPAAEPAADTDSAPAAQESAAPATDAPAPATEPPAAETAPAQ